jgi:biotin-dependent carboxylase-like uncharacterized protein
MKIQTLSPGLLTTVQDLGRWGFQGQGIPVAGAMDGFALQAGNILVGNERNLAALEITVMGPSLSVLEGEGMVCLTGAELDLRINGQKVPTWTALPVSTGDSITIGGPLGHGSRGYLCISGGIDVPLIMGSRSTYLRAAIGGLEGRSLRKGDIFLSGPNPSLWERCEGFRCPEAIRPVYGTGDPLRVIPGPQDDLFTSEGIETFLRSEYTITNDADRMGYRFEGPSIEHSSGADIVSDAIPLGSIQVPGHGKPIAMLADRQTTGGYTKIAVLATPDIAALAQKLPGEKVHFRIITLAEAIEETKREGKKLSDLSLARATYRSRQAVQTATPGKGVWTLSVEGTSYDVSWEALD